MAGKIENMKALQEKRLMIEAQILALTNQLKGLDIAISVVSGQGQEVAQVLQTKPPRGKNVKDTVLTVVQRSGSEGINARSLVDEAKSSLGIHLDRGSVSSLLSRLKSEGTLSLHVDSGKYFIPQPTASH